MSMQSTSIREQAGRALTSRRALIQSKQAVKRAAMLPSMRAALVRELRHRLGIHAATEETYVIGQGDALSVAWRESADGLVFTIEPSYSGFWTLQLVTWCDIHGRTTRHRVRSLADVGALIESDAPCHYCEWPLDVALHPEEVAP